MEPEKNLPQISRGTSKSTLVGLIQTLGLHWGEDRKGYQGASGDESERRGSTLLNHENVKWISHSSPQQAQHTTKPTQTSYEVSNSVQFLPNTKISAQTSYKTATTEELTPQLTQKQSQAVRESTHPVQRPPQSAQMTLHSVQKSSHPVQKLAKPTKIILCPVQKPPQSAQMTSHLAQKPPHPVQKQSHATRKNPQEIQGSQPFQMTSQPTQEQSSHVENLIKPVQDQFVKKTSQPVKETEGSAQEQLQPTQKPVYQQTVCQSTANAVNPTQHLIKPVTDLIGPKHPVLPAKELEQATQPMNVSTHFSQCPPQHTGKQNNMSQKSPQPYGKKQHLEKPKLEQPPPKIIKTEQEMERPTEKSAYHNQQPLQPPQESQQLAQKSTHLIGILAQSKPTITQSTQIHDQSTKRLKFKESIEAHEMEPACQETPQIMSRSYKEIDKLTNTAASASDGAHNSQSAHYEQSCINTIGPDKAMTRILQQPESSFKPSTPKKKKMNGSCSTQRLGNPQHSEQKFMGQQESSGTLNPHHTFQGEQLQHTPKSTQPKLNTAALASYPQHKPQPVQHVEHTITPLLPKQHAAKPSLPIQHTTQPAHSKQPTNHTPNSAQDVQAIPGSLQQKLNSPKSIQPKQLVTEPSQPIQQPTKLAQSTKHTQKSQQPTQYAVQSPHLRQHILKAQPIKHVPKPMQPNKNVPKPANHTQSTLMPEQQPIQQATTKSQLAQHISEPDAKQYEQKCIEHTEKGSHLQQSPSKPTDKPVKPKPKSLQKEKSAQTIQEPIQRSHEPQQTLQTQPSTQHSKARKFTSQVNMNDTNKTEHPQIQVTDPHPFPNLARTIYATDVTEGTTNTCLHWSEKNNELQEPSGKETPTQLTHTVDPNVMLPGQEISRMPLHRSMEWHPRHRRRRANRKKKPESVRVKEATEKSFQHQSTVTKITYTHHSKEKTTEHKTTEGRKEMSDTKDNAPLTSNRSTDQNCETTDTNMQVTQYMKANKPSGTTNEQTELLQLTKQTMQLAMSEHKHPEKQGQHTNGMSRSTEQVKPCEPRSKIAQIPVKRLDLVEGQAQLKITKVPKYILQVRQPCMEVSETEDKTVTPNKRPKANKNLTHATKPPPSQDFKAEIKKKAAVENRYEGQKTIPKPANIKQPKEGLSHATVVKQANDKVPKAQKRQKQPDVKESDQKEKLPAQLINRTRTTHIQTSERIAPIICPKKKQFCRKERQYFAGETKHTDEKATQQAKVVDAMKALPKNNLTEHKSKRLQVCKTISDNKNKAKKIKGQAEHIGEMNSMTEKYGSMKTSGHIDAIQPILITAQETKKIKTPLGKEEATYPFITIPEHNKETPHPPLVRPEHKKAETLLPIVPPTNGGKVRQHTVDTADSFHKKTQPRENTAVKLIKQTQLCTLQEGPSVKINEYQVKQNDPIKKSNMAEENAHRPKSMQASTMSATPYKKPVKPKHNLSTSTFQGFTITNEVEENVMSTPHDEIIKPNKMTKTPDGEMTPLEEKVKKTEEKKPRETYEPRKNINIPKEIQDLPKEELSVAEEKISIPVKDPSVSTIPEKCRKAKQPMKNTMGETKKISEKIMQVSLLQKKLTVSTEETEFRDKLTKPRSTNCVPNPKVNKGRPTELTNHKKKPMKLHEKPSGSRKMPTELSQVANVTTNLKLDSTKRKVRGDLREVHIERKDKRERALQSGIEKTKHIKEKSGDTANTQPNFDLEWQQNMNEANWKKGKAMMKMQSTRTQSTNEPMYKNTDNTLNTRQLSDLTKKVTLQLQQKPPFPPKTKVLTPKKREQKTLSKHEAKSKLKACKSTKYVGKLKQSTNILTKISSEKETSRKTGDISGTMKKDEHLCRRIHDMEEANTLSKPEAKSNLQSGKVTELKEMTTKSLKIQEKKHSRTENSSEKITRSSKITKTEKLKCHTNKSQDNQAGTRTSPMTMTTQRGLKQSYSSMYIPITPVGSHILHKYKEPHIPKTEHYDASTSTGVNEVQGSVFVKQNDYLESLSERDGRDGPSCTQDTGDCNADETTISGGQLPQDPVPHMSPPCSYSHQKDGKDFILEMSWFHVYKYYGQRKRLRQMYNKYETNQQRFIKQADKLERTINTPINSEDLLYRATKLMHLKKTQEVTLKAVVQEEKENNQCHEVLTKQLQDVKAERKRLLSEREMLQREINLIRKEKFNHDARQCYQRSMPTPRQVHKGEYLHRYQHNLSLKLCKTDEAIESNLKTLQSLQENHDDTILKRKELNRITKTISKKFKEIKRKLHKVQCLSSSIRPEGQTNHRIKRFRSLAENLHLQVERLKGLINLLQKVPKEKRYHIPTLVEVLTDDEKKLVSWSITDQSQHQGLKKERHEPYENYHLIGSDVWRVSAATKKHKPRKPSTEPWMVEPLDAVQRYVVIRVSRQNIWAVTDNRTYIGSG